MPSEQVTNWVYATVIAAALTIMVAPLLLSRKFRGRLVLALLLVAGLVGFIGVTVALEWLQGRCTLSEILWLACPRGKMSPGFVFSTRHLPLLYGLLVTTAIAIAILAAKRALSIGLRSRRAKPDDLA